MRDFENDSVNAMLPAIPEVEMLPAIPKVAMLPAIPKVAMLPAIPDVAVLPVLPAIMPSLAEEIHDPREYESLYSNATRISEKRLKKKKNSKKAKRLNKSSGVKKGRFSAQPKSVQMDLLSMIKKK
jgi:hypothetical protein